MYKVFIVDDEPFIIDGLYDIVDWARMGMEIVGQAENGQAALEALSHIPADILITDISMPVMNGLDLIRGVRSFKPDLKVIVLSGYDEFAYLKEGMALGIENYLLKPINLEEFQATLETICKKLDTTRASAASELSEQSVRILRDNVLSRWLCCQIGSSEFQERADLLDIRLERQYAMLTLLRTEHSGNEAFETAEKFLEASPYVILFRNMEGDMVLLHNFDDPVSGREEADRLEQGLKVALNSFGPIRAAQGSVERLADQAHLSYANAKKAQEYFMIFKDRETLKYEKLKSRVPSGKIPSINWNDCLKLFLARDKAALLSKIDQDFSQLGQVEGVTPGFLQDISLEWMLRFKMQLQEIRNAEEPGLFWDGYSRIQAVGSLEELIGIVKEAASEAVDALNRDVKSPVIQQVLNHLHESYNQDLSLKTLGSTYNIHPVYLGQLFHKEVGESFTEYINRYRIEKAKEQLKTTQHKVQEIARNVGYWETGYFYKQFKKYVGISPTEFKEVVQKVIL